MKKCLVYLAAGSLLVGFCGVSKAAGDAAAGKQKAAVCAACHGANGISTSPQFPNLAGQKQEYLILQLKAFRDGQRKNPTMSPMAAGLSDQDIDNLTAYFSSLTPPCK